MKLNIARTLVVFGCVVRAHAAPAALSPTPRPATAPVVRKPAVALAGEKTRPTSSPARALGQKLVRALGLGGGAGAGGNWEEF